MEQQNPDGFPSHAWDQSPLHGFLGHQSHGPPGATFWRVAADHGNDALPLAVLQQRGRSGPLLLVECPFEPPLLVAMADLPNGLWSQRNNGGNPRRANAFSQLQSATARRTTRTCCTPPLNSFLNAFWSFVVTPIRRAGRAIP